MDKQSSDKKNFPRGFFLFFLVSLLIALVIQNFSNTYEARVNFSHQLEHLVNMDLIYLKESQQVVSQNNNLVTFNGHFKSEISEDAKDRFKFLQLLDKQKELKIEEQKTREDIAQLKKSIYSSAAYYLQISGEAVPENGFIVVNDAYNTLDDNEEIVVFGGGPSVGVNLSDLDEMLVSLAAGSQEMYRFRSQLLYLVERFLSPALGIGSEDVKKTLRQLKIELRLENSDKRSELALLQDSLNSLKNVSRELSEQQGHIRLVQLRSVREYKNELDHYQILLQQVEQNRAGFQKAEDKVAAAIWFFNDKQLSTNSLTNQSPEEYHHWFLKAKEEWDNFPANKNAFFKTPDQPSNAVLKEYFKSVEPTRSYLDYIFTFLPVILILLLLYFVFFRQIKGVGNSAMNFGKSTAKMVPEDSIKVTFKDVAGIEEAKEELEEVVDFLKDPEKFTVLGGRIPKGVLCVGPPGTGKTLVAKAVAGEADRPFFSISGSDFVEMFVGVGASRIRDLFEQAKKNAPCIVFIDEIDAVGRHRGGGVGGGHDEREQTLNQLLVEMDGFDTNEGVILMAATNRPDVLDKALLRPGRFDRRIILDLPDIRGRFDILKVHAKKLKLDKSVDLMAIARSTPGSSGADLANLLNEAALLAARKGRSAITVQETREASDKVRFGKARVSLEIDEKEKETTAWHESGHAVVALVVEHADPVEKVTIIPRGFSLGATHFLPEKNKLSYWKKELIDQLAVLMGGRVAEELFVGDSSSGAQQDIKQATNLARSMVCEWGMNSKLGLVAYQEKQEGGQYLGMSQHTSKSYSEETAQIIDTEVKELIMAAYTRAEDLLKENETQVDLMTKMLLEFETLDAKDLKLIMSGEWSAEGKRERLKEAEELNKKLEGELPPALPGKEKEEKEEVKESEKEEVPQES
jgi:cell division protease FtsH